MRADAYQASTSHIINEQAILCVQTISEMNVIFLTKLTLILNQPLESVIVMSEFETVYGRLKQSDH